MHATNPDSITGIPYSPLSRPEMISEYIQKKLMSATGCGPERRFGSQGKRERRHNVMDTLWHIWLDMVPGMCQKPSLKSGLIPSFRDILAFETHQQDPETGLFSIIAQFILGRET